MKKLITLLGALSLSISPMMSIVSCGSIPIIKPMPTPAAAMAAASIKTKIYEKILENYSSKEKVMSKTIAEEESEEEAGEHEYLALSLDEMNSADFTEGNGTKTGKDFGAKMSSNDLLNLTKDLNYLLNLDNLANQIGNIANQKDYDIITSQIHKKIFKSWNIVPISINRMFDTTTNEIKMAQYSFSISVNYQIFLDGSVQDITSDKIDCSFTLTSDAVLHSFISWANKTVSKYLFLDNQNIANGNSPLHFNSSDETFGISSISDWENKFNDFKKSFNSNVNEYFLSESFLKNRNVLSRHIDYILNNYKDYGFSDDGVSLFGNLDEIPETSINIDSKELITPEVIYGVSADYTSVVPKINVSTDKVNGNQRIQDIIDLSFGNVAPDLKKLDRASEGYADLNENISGFDPSIAHPLNSDEFKKDYLAFIGKYGISSVDIPPIATGEDFTKALDNDNKIYSYGHVNFEPIEIGFSNFSGTFKLNLSAPWSFALAQSESKTKPGEVDRRDSTMSYFVALNNWKKALKVKFFDNSNNNQKSTAFMKLDTYDKRFGRAESDKDNNKYVDVDPDYYGKGDTNPDIYNMLKDMNDTGEGTSRYNLDTGDIAKSSVWDNAIGKLSRNAIGNTQYYFEKYAGLLPSDETLKQWKDQSRLAEENGLAYFGFHYGSTDPNNIPTADVSLPFTSFRSLKWDDFDDPVPHIPSDSDGNLDRIGKKFHAKIRHEKDEDFNANELVYTLAMGNYGLLNFSFPSFNDAEAASNSGTPLQIKINQVPYSIWSYLWNPHSEKDMPEAMRIIGDNDIDY